MQQTCVFVVFSSGKAIQKPSQHEKEASLLFLLFRLFWCSTVDGDIVLPLCIGLGCIVGVGNGIYHQPQMRYTIGGHAIAYLLADAINRSSTQSLAVVGDRIALHGKESIVPFTLHILGHYAVERHGNLATGLGHFESNTIVAIALRDAFIGNGILASLALYCHKLASVSSAIGLCIV